MYGASLVVDRKDLGSTVDIKEKDVVFRRRYL